MNQSIQNRPVFSCLLFTIVFCVCGVANGQAVQSKPATASGNWTQWGGDNGRNFTVPDVELSASPVVEETWSRELGGGYSGVLADDQRLFTMYREGDNEVTICMDAKTGKTIWQKQFDATLPKKTDSSFGKGPNSTPLLADGRLVTIGFLGDMRCVDAATGDVIWQTSLWKDHKATELGFGFSASPLLYKGNLIVPVGGKGQTIKAFSLKDGSVSWSALDYDNSYCTPLLIDVDGLPQLVISLTESVIGVSPDDGSELWSFPLKNQWDTHAFVPVWDAERSTLFVSSFRQSHALKLKNENGNMSCESKWSIEKTGIGFTNAVQIGDVVYGTSGGTRSPLMTAFSLTEGKVLWKERGFGISNFLAVGDRLVLLDEKGNLAVAQPNETELNVISQNSVLQSEKGWTYPTMIGNTIYVRNQKTIAALTIK